jgi:amidohydrolase
MFKGINIKKEIAKHEAEMIELRRDIHRNPELGYEEYRTSKIVQDYLEALGMDVSIITKTGVIGILKGNGEGATVLLRADMDALLVDEQTGVDYASEMPGKMHACGHDGHTAMLLITAKILAAHKDEWRGNVKFVFQPNEEEAGALAMIEEGILENPKVDAAFAIHLWSPIESGKVGLVPGAMMGATEEFEVDILGQAGHTAVPHTALDPELCASAIVIALQSIQTREINPLWPITIMIGKHQGGTARNIIPNKVNLGGTIRFAFEDEKNEKPILLEKFERVIRGTCESYGTDYDLRFIPSNPSVLNNKELTEEAKKVAIETYGDVSCIEEYRCMVGEDFAEFTQRVPSVFAFIGCGNKKKDTEYPHHHPKFNIDEDVMKYGVEFHLRNTLRFLSNH